MKSKFTFKRGPKPTGLNCVARPHPAVDIKYKKKVVGQINPPDRFSRYPDKWSIWFHIKRTPTPGHNCPFANRPISQAFEDEEEARKFINEGHCDNLIDSLYQIED